MLRLQDRGTVDKTSVVMSVLSAVHILILGVLAIQVYRYQPKPLQKFFFPALLVKCVAGIAVGLLYFYYYTGDDTFVYFTDASQLTDLAHRDPGAYFRFLWTSELPDHVKLLSDRPRALFFSKYTSVLCLFTGPNYWVISILFSFISFISAWYLVRLIAETFEIVYPAVIAFLFFPSVVFWSSGLMKESTAMATIFFLTVIFLKLFTGRRVRLWEWLGACFALWLLWNIKYYFVAILLPVMSALLLMRLLIEPNIRMKSKLVYCIVFSLVFVIPLYVATLVHPNFYPERFLGVIASNNEDFIALSSPQDVIHFSGLSSSFSSVVIHLPKAIVSGMYRPFIWEASHVLQVIAGVENLLLLSLTVWAIAAVIKNRERSIGKTGLLFWGIVIYVVLLSAFLTLSTPNFGTLSRYRVGFLPFFVLILLIPNPIVRKFNQWL
jgi:hypothetical protein